MRARLFVALIFGLTLAAKASARQDNVFFLGRERPQRVVITNGDDFAEDVRERAHGSEMLRALDGVIADLSAQELGLFLATPMPRTRLLDARGNLERLGVAHVFGREGVKRVELFSGNEGVFLAQEMDAQLEDESPRVSRLSPERFRPLLLKWSRYAGAFDEATREAVATGQLVEMPGPYLQAPIFLDADTLSDRFVRGTKSRLPPLSRVLADETMYVRLPRGYDPRHPAGVLVWISAAREGRVPGVFDAALDELGIIGVGIRDVGNDREVTDRLQLALDAAWTASRRFHVDIRRVYVTGISGGGRVASRLLVCFPDFFTGAVPIVGMDSYSNVPVGNGQFLPAMYRRPEAKLWALAKKRRMGVITGDGDSNAVGIREGARIMAGDGMAVRVFDYKGLGHEMASAAQIRESLAWVDEPYRKERVRETKAAREALEKYIQRNGNRAPANDRGRAELVRITELGPWTDASWEAVVLLRGAGAGSRK